MNDSFLLNTSLKDGCRFLSEIRILLRDERAHQYFYMEMVAPCVQTLPALIPN